MYMYACRVYMHIHVCIHVCICVHTCIYNKYKYMCIVLYMDKYICIIFICIYYIWIHCRERIQFYVILNTYINI